MIEIKSDALRSLKWTTLGMVLPKLISPLITLWLVNILNPSDYGLLAVSSVIIGFATLLQGFGLIEFLIKEKELSELRLNTIFWSSVFLGTLMAITIVLLSPLLSEIYKNNGLLKIIPALSITIILSALQLVQNALLQKGLDFKKIFIIQLLPLIVLTCVTLPLALFGWGVWSLVIGQISNGIISVLMYFFFTRWNPIFIFSMKELKLMLGFGKWVIVEKIFEYFYSNLDIIIISLYFDTSTVGIYSIGKYFITIIYTIINGSIGAIAFPLLSHIQSNEIELKIAFLGITKRIAFFNIPLMVGVLMLSSSFVPLVFVQKWESLPLVLSITVLGEGIMRNIWVQRDIFKLLNKPEIYPKSIIINLVFSLIFFTIASRFGIIAFCVVKVLNDIIYTFVQITLTSRILKFKLFEFFAVIKYSVGASLFMAITLGTLLILFKYFETEISLPIIAIIILSGASSYFITHYVCDRVNFLHFISEFKSAVNKNEKLELGQ
jgi:O-antigen/teichoic acid export membrane protein